MWAWMAIVLVLVVAYSLYKKNKTASTATAATSANTPGGVDASLVPQFINQTYTNETPPAAPNVTVNNNIPAPPTPPPTTNPGGPTQPLPPPPTTTPTSPKPPAPRPTAPFEPIFNGSYTVKKGQTLQMVAQQFGITREQLAHANGLGTGAGLRDGQVLRVPNPAPGGKPNPAQ
jgi:LysM repeat protein